MKVIFFFSTKDLTPEILKGLNDLIVQVYSNDPRISFEKVFIEDSPKVTKFYNITATPFTIIGDKRFPGIATAEQILKIKSQIPEAEVSMQAKPGATILLSGSALSKVLGIIRDMDRTGRKVLLVTRTYPEALSRHYGIDTNEMVWLVPKAVNDTSVSMNNIVKLGQIIGDFIDKNEGALVVLDGLEGLVKNNPLNNVLGFIQVLRFKVAQRKATAYVLILPSAMDESDLLEVQKIFS